MTDSSNLLSKSPGPTSQWFYSQRLRLHYVDWGSAETTQSTQASNLLLVHGVQDHCRTWDWVAREFASDYRVLAPDLRGHGDSAWATGANYQVWDYVYDLWQLIQSRDLAPVTLVAHSMGATIAAAYAGAFPETVAKLVLIEGVGLWPGHYSEMSAAQRLQHWCTDVHDLSRRNQRRYPEQGAVTERMRVVNPQLADAQVEHLARHGSFQNEDGSYSWKFDNYTHGPGLFGIPEQQTIELWRNISAPTLILNADAGFDHRIGQNGTLDYFTHAELGTIADAGHWTYHDQLQPVLDALRGFGI